MLNLNYSSSNTLSVLPDISGLTLSNNDLFIDFTQSYDLSGKGNIEGTITKYNNFLTFTIPANTLPTASGQYKIEIYTTTGGGAVSYEWIQVPTTFINTNWLWKNGSDNFQPTVKDQLISTTYGYVHGTNDPIFTSLPTGNTSSVEYAGPSTNNVEYNNSNTIVRYSQLPANIVEYDNNNTITRYTQGEATIIQYSGSNNLIVQYSGSDVPNIQYSGSSQSNIYYQNNQTITQYTSSNEYGEYETYNL